MEGEPEPQVGGARRLPAVGRRLRSARIVVRDRTTHVLLGVSAPQPAFSTSAGFGRSAKTLRWAGSTGVSMVPWSGLLGERGTVRADLAHLVDWTPWPDYEPVDPSSKRPEVQFREN